MEYVLQWTTRNYDSLIQYSFSMWKKYALSTTRPPKVSSLRKTSKFASLFPTNCQIISWTDDSTTNFLIPDLHPQVIDENKKYRLIVMSEFVSHCHSTECSFPRVTQKCGLGRARQPGEFLIVDPNIISLPISFSLT